MSGAWRTIDSAPKSGAIHWLDGEKYESGPDLLLTNGTTITVGSFESGRWFVVEGGLFRPTHWQLLPELPATITRHEGIAS